MVDRGRRAPAAYRDAREAGAARRRRSRLRRSASPSRAPPGRPRPSSGSRSDAREDATRALRTWLLAAPTSGYTITADDRRPVRADGRLPVREAARAPAVDGADAGSHRAADLGLPRPGRGDRRAPALFTVPDELMRSLEIALLTFGGMRQAATVLRTTSGRGPADPDRQRHRPGRRDPRREHPGGQSGRRLRPARARRLQVLEQAGARVRRAAPGLQREHRRDARASSWASGSAGSRTRTSRSAPASASRAASCRPRRSGSRRRRRTPR